MKPIARIVSPVKSDVVAIEFLLRERLGQVDNEWWSSSVCYNLFDKLVILTFFLCG